MYNSGTGTDLFFYNPPSIDDQYDCKFCSKSFPSELEREVHQNAHPEAEAASSSTESANPTSGSPPRVIEHLNLKLFTCHICSKSFSLPKHLTLHLSNHKRESSGQGPFTCHVCSKVFQSQSERNGHTRVHSVTKDNNYSGGKSYSCGMCEERFRLKKDLTKHRKIHTVVKTFTCDICSQTFFEKSALTQHLIIHAGETSADFYSKGIDDKTDQEYLDMHVGENPLPCSSCSKTFNSFASLNKHMKQHLEDQPLSCYICSKNFKEKTDLIKHLSTHITWQPFASGSFIQNPMFYGQPSFSIADYVAAEQAEAEQSSDKEEYSDND